MTYLSEHLSAGFMQPGPGPGCKKPALSAHLSYESVMGTLGTLLAPSYLSVLRGNLRAHLRAYVTLI